MTIEIPTPSQIPRCQSLSPMSLTQSVAVNLQKLRKSKMEEKLLGLMTEDPISDLARKERRNLLLMCSLGLVIALTGFLPDKVQSFGIEFKVTEKLGMLFIVMGVILYFGIAFVVYVWNDAANYMFKRMFLEQITDESESDVNIPNPKTYYTTRNIRFVFDVLFSPVLGVATISCLIWRYVMLVK